MEIENVKCSYCRRMIPIIDAIIEFGKYYHPRCYYQKESIRAERLEKKVQAKTITLDEAEELKELIEFGLPFAKRAMQKERKYGSMVDLLACPTPTFKGPSPAMKRITALQKQALLEERDKMKMIEGRIGEEKEEEEGSG